MIPSNLSNEELIRLNEYRDDLTELERELLTRLDNATFDEKGYEDSIEGFQVFADSTLTDLERMSDLMDELIEGHEVTERDGESFDRAIEDVCKTALSYYQDADAKRKEMQF